MTWCVKKYKKWLVAGLVAAIAIMATTLALTPAANAGDAENVQILDYPTNALETPKDNSWLHLDDLSATYEHYVGPNFNAYFDGTMKDALSLNVDSTVCRYFFWNSLIHSTTDSYQFRTVGLEMTVGVRLSPAIDVFARHHSQHTLDSGDDWGRHYPMENGVGITVHFLSSSPRDTVF